MIWNETLTLQTICHFNVRFRRWGNNYHNLSHRSRAQSAAVEQTSRVAARAAFNIGNVTNSTRTPGDMGVIGACGASDDGAGAFASSSFDTTEHLQFGHVELVCSHKSAHS